MLETTEEDLLISTCFFLLLIYWICYVDYIRFKDFRGESFSEKISQVSFPHLNLQILWATFGKNKPSLSK